MTTRLVLLLFLAGLPLDSRAQADPSEPGPPAPDLPALQALDDGWNTLHPGGATGCAWGGKYEFYVRPGDPERVFVYMYGGGGCWDEETCAPGGHYLGEIQAHLGPDRQGGLLDQAHPENPFRDHLMVAAPYCTADVHLGDAERTYDLAGQGDAPATVTIQHRGRANVDAVLSWLEATPVFFDVIHEIMERADPPVNLYLTKGWYNSRPEATAEEMISVLEAVRDRIRTGLQAEAVAPASAPPGSAPASGGPGR